MGQNVELRGQFGRNAIVGALEHRLEFGRRARTPARIAFDVALEGRDVVEPCRTRDLDLSRGESFHALNARGVHFGRRERQGRVQLHQLGIDLGSARILRHSDCFGSRAAVDVVELGQEAVIGGNYQRCDDSIECSGESGPRRFHNAALVNSERRRCGSTQGREELHGAIKLNLRHAHPARGLSARALRELIEETRVVSQQPGVAVEVAAASEGKGLQALMDRVEQEAACVRRRSEEPEESDAQRIADGPPPIRFSTPNGGVIARHAQGQA